MRLTPWAAAWNFATRPQLRETKVTNVTNVSLEGIVTVDKHAHAALSVFEDDTHPSVQGIGTGKEGFSLMGVLSAGISSQPGRELLRQWLKRPLSDCDLIDDRLNTIEFLLHLRHSGQLLIFWFELSKHTEYCLTHKRLFTPGTQSSKRTWLTRFGV